MPALAGAVAAADGSALGRCTITPKRSLLDVANSTPETSLHAHMGDPCIYCHTPHDEVKPGPCPAREWWPGKDGWCLENGEQKHNFVRTYKDGWPESCKCDRCGAVAPEPFCRTPGKCSAARRCLSEIACND